jgi:hypothetical protein
MDWTWMSRALGIDLLIFFEASVLTPKTNLHPRPCLRKVSDYLAVLTVVGLAVYSVGGYVNAHVSVGHAIAV